MDDKHLKLLLIEDNPGDARLIRELLSEEARIELEWVDRISKGLGFLAERKFDVILLDLDLPDSKGLETLYRVKKHTQKIPIVIMTGISDKEAAYEAIREGAQDYVVKGTMDSQLLIRTIRYATERKQAEETRLKLNKQLKVHIRNWQEIANALMNDVGINRASGILYDCGWKAAIREGKAFRKDWKGPSEEFVKKYFELSSSYEKDDINLKEFDILNNRARITIKHYVDAENIGGKLDLICRYMEGFLAGLFSLSFGVAVGVTEIKCILKENDTCEFKTRKLKTYEKNAYDIGALTSERS